MGYLTIVVCGVLTQEEADTLLKKFENENN